MNYREVMYLAARYFVLLLLSFNNLIIFYTIFTLPTLYASYILIKIVHFEAVVNGTTHLISVGEDAIELIPACIAGAAYYLLVILNGATPMPWKSRVKSLVFLTISFLFLNVVRIFIFSLLFLSGGGSQFDLAHKFTWYFGSTLLVVIVWFVNVKIFSLREIPVYSDIKNILEDIFPRTTAPISNSVK